MDAMFHNIKTIKHGLVPLASGKQSWTGLINFNKIWFIYKIQQNNLAFPQTCKQTNKPSHYCN